MSASSFNRAALDSLLKKRYFFAPSFEIYGGVAGFYDYGPPGCALQANILAVWRNHFVLEEDMLEVDNAIITPFEVFEASGHVAKFTDWMVRDVKTGAIARADHLVEEALEARLKQSDAGRQEIEEVLAKIGDYNGEQLEAVIRKFDIRNPETGNELSTPETFNLMFPTSIGPSGHVQAYLRPETAQGHFVNFKKLLEYNNNKIPFASAQIGRAFRNEISPRTGLIRVREFTMAEIEHFVDPEAKTHRKFARVAHVVLRLLPASVQMTGNTTPMLVPVGDAVQQRLIDNETLGYFMARIHLFLQRIGIDIERVRFRQHMKNEMAHYACDCWDAEIHISYGWKECVGCADRSAYDLTQHTQYGKEKLLMREMLPEPRVVEQLEPVLNKKVLGKALKAGVKQVEETLAHMDQKALAVLRTELENGQGLVRVSDGQEVSVTAEMLRVDKVTKTVHVREYVPNVIEPSFGIGRILYALLEHAFWTRSGDEARAVLSLPITVAPYKCLLVPLSSHASLQKPLDDIEDRLRALGIPFKIDSSSASIGKRYARNDELGTPFGITIDFQTVSDGTVTLRERNSTKQVRGKMEAIVEVLDGLLAERTTWDAVQQSLPAFTEQEVAGP